MSQQIMGFGYSCLGHIKDVLRANFEDVSGMSFSVEPVYGKAGESARIGITTHTESCAKHHDVIGYRLKIGFPTMESRAAASKAIEDIHHAIKSVFELQNDAAWVLRDKNTHEVWFTFVTRDKAASAFFDQKLATVITDTIFKQRGLSIP